jgi:thiol-disulfide isomerase/thioredoxin
MRLSKPIEALISSMIAEGPAAKRPPHIVFCVSPGSGFRPGADGLCSVMDLLALAEERRMKKPGLKALGLAAMLYGALALTANPTLAAGLDAEGRSAVMAMRQGDMGKLVIHEAPKPRLSEGFENENGKRMTLADFAGKMVVLNFWATWCPPCRAEMPSLDRLAGIVKKDGVEVVALSTDRGGVRQVKPFFDEIGVKNLAIYNDKTNKTAREAALIGLPVTLILDRQGREIARLTGDAHWDSDTAVAIVRRLADLTKGAQAASLFKKVPAEGEPKLTQ